MLNGAEYMDLVNVLNDYKLPVGEWDYANAGRGAPYTRQDNGEVVNPTFTTDRITNTAAGTDPSWCFPCRLPGFGISPARWRVPRTRWKRLSRSAARPS